MSWTHLVLHCSPHRYSLIPELATATGEHSFAFVSHLFPTVFFTLDER